MSWRPKDRPVGWRNSTLWSHKTYGEPKLPFIRSNRGQLVHRVRYWALGWERPAETTRLAYAVPHTWCGMSMSGSRSGYSIGADVRLMADSAAELCLRCFPREIVHRVFEVGRLASSVQLAELVPRLVEGLVVEPLRPGDEVG